MTCCHNPELQSWKDERLPEIKRAEARRVALDHIRGIRERYEAKGELALPEPLRTELISITVAFENLLDYVDAP